MAELSRINVNADFGGGGEKGIEKALSDGRRLREDAEKSKKLSKEIRALEAEAFADAVANNAEVIKSNEKVRKSTEQVSAQRKKEIELQQELTRLTQEYDRISEQRGRKSAIRSKKDLEFVNQEIRLLESIKQIQEELGIIDVQKQRRLERLQKSFDGYVSKAQDAYKAEEAVSAATEKAGKAIEKKAEKTKKATKETEALTGATEQLSLSFEKNVSSVEEVDKAEEKLSKNRQSRREKEANAGKGGRGGAAPPPAPPGGGGPPEDDFDWEKYLQKIEERRRQITVEIQSAEGARLRALQRELRALNEAEGFEENRARVEYLRATALEKINKLQEQITKETDKTSASARRLRTEIDSLEKRISDADAAIFKGRGNADALADALRRGVLNADLLLVRTQEENIRRERAIELQRQALDGQYGTISAQIESLQHEKDSLTVASAQKQIQSEINALVRRRSALSLQLARTDEISTREIERSKAAIDELVISSERAVESARDSETLYRTVLDLNRRRFEDRINGLRAQKELVSDPKAIQALERQIDAAEEKLSAFLREFEGGRGSVESLTRALESTEYRIESTLEKTKEQNDEYERQRQIAETNTRGLREDIRSAELILSRELARTKNLEARRALEKAISDLQEQDRRRQRDIRAGDFSEAQFRRLLLSTQEAVVEGTRARERAVRTERDYNIEVVKQRAVIREIQELLRDRAPLFKAGFSTNDIDKFELALEKLRRELKDTTLAGRSVDDLGRRLRTFRSDIESSRVPLNRFEQAIEKLRNRFGFLDKAFSRLDASSRGFSLFTTLATTVIEPLAAVVLQLAGGLTAVAASALSAGAALGGALVAGAAQAIPVLALLGAGFKSLIDVVQISNRQRQDQANNLARDARGVGGAAAAADKLKSSQEGLTSAQRQLNDARRQAIRDLADLADKEREAELAAQSATLSVIEAQVALQDAVKNGSALDVRRAQIALAGARVSERQAERELGRIGADAARTRGEGVEGNEQVISAKRALAQAERQLAEARRRGAGAASDLTQATARLNEQIKQLSPGQRELLRSINRLRAVFRTGPFVEIRDIILQPFTSAVKYLTDIGKDTGITGSFLRLADSISKTLGRAVDRLFGPTSKEFIAFVNGEAATNIDTLGAGFEALGSILAKIATSAAPVFRDVLNGITDTFERIDQSLTQSGLNSFFKGAQKSLDAFGQVAEESFLLIKNLFELSAPTGDTLVSTFATFIRGINQQLADPKKRREIQSWFEEVGRGFAEFGGALADLGTALFANLDAARLGQFASFVSEVVAPALEGLVRTSKLFVDAIAAIGKIPFAGDLAAIAIQIVVLGKTFSTLIGIAALLKTSLFGLANAFAEITTVSKAASGAQGLASLTTVLTYSNGKLKDTADGATKATGALGKLGAARGLMRNLGSALGALGPYGAAAGIALALFGDRLIEIIPGLETVEEKANKAKRALLDLASVSSDKANADLALERSIISQQEAILSRQEAAATVRAAKRKLANAETVREKRVAERELQAAELAFQSASLSVKEANQRVADAQTQVTAASSKVVESAKQAAKVAETLFNKPQASVFTTKGGQTKLTPQTKETRVQDLRNLIGNDEDWKNIDEYTRAKVQGILETIIREKGSIPKDKLQIVLEAVASNESIKDILKELDIKIPKGIKVDVLFDQNKIRSEASAAGKTVEDLVLEKFAKLARIAGDKSGTLAGAVAQTDAGRGRPIAYADGGIVKATPGGVRIRAGEDGYDEYIITTDPTKKSRSLQLLDRVARRLQVSDSGGKIGVSEGDPPSLRGKARGGADISRVARDPLSSFFTMFRRARALDALDIPYSWGGGHTTPATPSTGIRSDGKDGTGIVGLDCSSSVSAVLQSALPGFPTVTSGEFPRQSGMVPGRGVVTIWSNDKHVFMSFGNEDWGTNSGEPGNGPGFHQHSKGGYTASHPRGLSTRSRDSSIFGRVFNALYGSDVDKISALDNELSGLGKSSRSFKPNYSGGVMLDAANTVIGSVLRGFQKFQTGGTVSGATNSPQLAIVHGGETVLDVPSSRSMKGGDTAQKILKDFTDSIKNALKSIQPVFSDGFKKVFNSLGFNLDTNPNKRGRQVGERDNIKVGKKTFSVLDAAVEFISGGYDPKKDPEAKALLSSSSKKIKSALAAITTRFAAYFDGLLSGISERYATSRESADTAGTIAATQRQGSFSSALNRFVFAGAGTQFQRFTSQAGVSAADAQADIDALVGKRASLIQESADLQAVINSSNASLSALRPKADALRGIIAGLRQKRSDIAGRKVTKSYTKKKKDADLAEVDKLISAAQTELDNVNSQIQIAENAIKQATTRQEAIGGEVAQTESQVGEAQGRKIDALISQATSGRYTAAQAEQFLGEAERLATSTNDAVRLEAIRKARFAVGQSQASAQIGLEQSRLRLAQLTGDQTGQTTALTNIGNILRQQRIDLQGEIDRLIGEGLDPNSQEIIALRTNLSDLDISIQENTNALNGTTTQNFSSTAWQLFRRAIFSGNSQILGSYAGFDQATAAISTPVSADPGMVSIMPIDAGGSSSSVSKKTNVIINVNEANQVADPVYLASRLAFEISGR